MYKEIIYQQFAWENILRFVVSFFYVTLSISPSSQSQSWPSSPLLPSSPHISFPVISSHLLFPATFTSLLFSSLRPCFLHLSSVLIYSPLLCSHLISSALFSSYHSSSLHIISSLFSHFIHFYPNNPPHTWICSAWSKVFSLRLATDRKSTRLNSSHRR